MVEKNKKLLSILIPTYNRAKYLDNCLDSIFSQLDEELRNKIEIIVSNNASVDNTKEIMEKYSKNKEIDYKYSSNIENLGFDGNFYKLHNEANSLFCWILGDNEYLEKKCLKKIVEILEKNKDTGVIYISNRIKNKNLEQVTSNKFLEKVSYNITFISAIIWKKDYQIKLDYSEVKDSLFTQVFFYLNNLNKIEKNLIIHGKYFSSLEVGNGGYKLFDIFSNSFNRVLLKYQINDKVIDKINKDMCLKFFPIWILESKKNNKNTNFKQEDIYMTLKKIQAKYIYFWLIDYPLLRLNYFIGKIYYLPFKLLLRIRSIINE